MASGQAMQGAEASDQVLDAGQGEQENGWIALGRAVAGALIFSISLLMTMETWWLGFSMNRWRFMGFLVVSMLLLMGLAYYRGFREDLSWRDAVIDAFVGYAVGVITGALFLALFGVIKWGMPPSEVIGKIALQSSSSAIGALLARAQLGGGKDKSEKAQEKEQHYLSEIFLMIVGAIFISYTVAPTEEIVLIAYQMTPWHAVSAVIISLLILHIFVYQVGFHGQEAAPEGSTFWSLFLKFTVVGYLFVFLTSFYILWTFGRIDGVEVPMMLIYAVVLSVPGALGAAAARLIL